jgi:mannosyltransferase
MTRIHGHSRTAEVGLASSYQDALWVGVVMIACFCLRLLMIDHSSLWWDESFSIWYSRQRVSDLLGVIWRLEANPPTYYIALKGWTAVFGESDVAVRSLSAFYGACAVPLVYLTASWMAPKAASHRTGLIAAILFSLSFLQLRYAQEARAFTQFALALAATLAAMTYILRLRAQGRMPSLLVFVSLGVVSSLILWSHYAGVVYACLIWATTALWWLLSERADRQILARLLLSFLCFVLLAGPSIWALIRIHPMIVNDWIKAPGLRDLISLVSLEFSADLGTRRRFGVEMAARVAVFGVWPILGLFAIFRGDNSFTRRAGLLMLLSSVGIVGLLAVFSYLVRPILLERTAFPAQLGWIVLCAFAPLAFPPRWTRLATIVLVMCFALGATAYFRGELLSPNHEDWRGMAAEIRARTPGRLQVLTEGGGGVLLRRYLGSSEGEFSSRVAEYPEELSLAIGRDQLENNPPGIAWWGGSIDTALDRIVVQLNRDQSAWLVLRNPKDDLIAELAQRGVKQEVRMGFLVAFRGAPAGEVSRPNGSSLE